MRFINTGKTAGYINLEHVAQFGTYGEDQCWLVMAGIQGATHLSGEACTILEDAIEAHNAEMAEMREAWEDGR